MFVRGPSGALMTERVTGPDTDPVRMTTFSREERDGKPRDLYHHPLAKLPEACVYANFDQALGFGIVSVFPAVVRTRFTR